MDIIVENSFGTKFLDIMYNLIFSFNKFWELISYSFGTIDLKWLWNLLGIDNTSILYVEYIDISFSFVLSSGLIIILLIHLVKAFI